MNPLLEEGKKLDSERLIAFIRKHASWSSTTTSSSFLKKK
jgi:hypothetical protein